MKSNALPSRLVREIESLPERLLPQLEEFVRLHKEHWLAERSGKPPVRLAGLLKDYPLTDEEIAQARREMWGRFGERDLT